MNNTTDILDTALDVAEVNEDKELLKEVLKYKDVPIVYAPTKAMLKSPKDPGLSNLIFNATTVSEVLNLVKKGEIDYKNASQGTIRKWKKIAQKRIEELTK